MKKPARAYRQMSEEELQQRLFKLITAIVVTIVVMLAALLLFGPKIGALFGFFSVHRNEEETDTLAPNPPSFLNLPESVKETTLSIKGFSEAGSSVKLFVNGPEVASAEVGEDGSFSFDVANLIQGKNTIFAKAFDKSGNESGKSETVMVTVDRDKPEIKLKDLKNGTVVRNLDKRVLVKGSVNEKAAVKINDRLAIVRPDLTFELVLGVEEGSVEIKVEAVDEAGNKAEEKITITYQKSGV